MTVEYWSQEDLAKYHDDPGAFIARAHALRSKVICELLIELKNRIVAFFR